MTKDWTPVAMGPRWQMAAARFIGHFPHGFCPIQNHGEEAVFYCFVFLYMATQGAGIWSVDRAKEKG